MGKLVVSLLGSLAVASLVVFELPVAAQTTAASPETADRQAAAASESDSSAYARDDRPERLAEAIAVLVVDVDGVVGRAVTEFYERREYRPAWLEPSGQRAARMLLSRAAAAHEDGLDPAPYGAERLARELATARAGDDADAALDVAITGALVRFIVELGMGRDAVRDSRASARRVDITAALEEARRDGTPDAFEGVAPRRPEYTALREALARYRELDAAGGFPLVPEDVFLGPGASIPEDVYAALRHRLRMTGDLDELPGVSAGDAPDGERQAGAWDASDVADGDEAPAASPEEYEYGETLVEAVRRFQARHGLQVDGIIGPQTVSALNVPVADRITQIALNLDRWRRLPDDLGRRHVRVNIPDYSLAVVEDGRTTLTMRTIVGRTDRQTPVFSDRIRYLEFRPSWNVPDSIVQHDILPRVQEDPGYLEANRYDVLEDWGGPPAEVDLEGFDWEAETFTWRLRQRPGPHNALGLVKFMFPNRYAVYLHDTPTPRLFERRVRTFSSGCVRVEDPVGLATALLAREEESWTPDRVRAAMHAHRTSVTHLSEPVPVHLSYFTAWVDDAGLATFRSDVYGRDARARERLSIGTEE